MPALTLALLEARDGESRELELAFDHPMESGARHDGRGTRIPPWFLTRVTLHHDGGSLATLRPGPAVASNPRITLALPASVSTGTLRVNWEDNRGERGSRTLAIDTDEETPSAR